MGKGGGEGRRGRRRGGARSKDGNGSGDAGEMKGLEREASVSGIRRIVPSCHLSVGGKGGDDEGREGHAEKWMRGRGPDVERIQKG